MDSGHGGTVAVRASELTLDGTSPSSEIFTSTLGEAEEAGNAGAIRIEAEHVSLSGCDRAIPKPMSGSCQLGSRWVSTVCLHESG